MTSSRFQAKRGFPQTQTSCPPLSFSVLLRLRMKRTRWGRTSSATTRPRCAAGRTSTCGKCRSASLCRQGNTCWSPPPSSRTKRPTSSSASSLRKRPKPCESSVNPTVKLVRKPNVLRFTTVTKCCLFNREMGTNVDADLPEVNK